MKELSLQNTISSKFLFSLTSLFLLLFSTSNLAQLEAGGWGSNIEVTTYENVTWNSIYYDLNGLKYTAQIPNYCNGCLKNGVASMYGKHTDGNFAILSCYNALSDMPATVQKFARAIQEANPQAEVVILGTDIQGANYALELIPRDSTEQPYWRFFCVSDRIVRMGTSDQNENRRAYFFDSIKFE